MDRLSPGAGGHEIPDHRPGTVVVSLPIEVDNGNAEEVREELAAVIAPGVRAVIADGTQTVFCDSSAMAVLVQAQKVAAARAIEFRVVVPHHHLRDRLIRTGLASYLAIYPTLADALQPSRGNDVSDRRKGRGS